jgi:hypothetical protein
MIEREREREREGGRERERHPKDVKGAVEEAGGVAPALRRVEA